MMGGFVALGQRYQVELQPLKAFSDEQPIGAAEASDESAEGLVLRPTSGRSDDALTLANYIYEQAHPAAATVRFVQFVPRIDVQP